MLAHERRERIAKLVAKEKSVLVKDLCKMFDVTSETIRKDLLLLEQQGKLLKTHGGAYMQEGAKSEVHINIRETILSEEKDAIGKQCAELIEDGDTIILDASTTSLRIAYHLDAANSITVLTNSLKVAARLADHPSCKIIMAGGLLNKKSDSFLGRDAENIIGKYYVDKCFISCRGISMDNGITDSNEDQSVIRRMMLNQSKNRYLVVDKTKCDVTSLARIGGLEMIDTLVIDELPNVDWRKFLRNQKIECIEAMNK